MKTYTYEPQIGADIKSVIVKCIELSQHRSMKGLGSLVEFTFNGIVLTIDHEVSIDTGYWISVWETSTKERREPYEKTPEYKAKQTEQSVSILQNQERCNNLMTILLHSQLQNGAALDAWMLEFIPVADYVGVGYSKQAVIDVLEHLGYVAGEFVGYEGEWDTDTKCRWVYGQILDGLKNHPGIHPIFADKIKELKTNQ